MKKALLMTWYNSNNYGTLLQSYATKEIFKQRYNVDCYFVNYVPKGKRDLVSIIKKLLNIKSWKRQFNSRYDLYMFKKYGIDKNIQKRKNWVNDFISEYKYALDNKQIKTEADFNELSEGFDLYISGSDQIWNPRFLNEHFLLNFVPDDKNCVSFASSLSAEKIPEKQVNVYKKHLAKYNGITIREKDCETQIKNILGGGLAKIGTILDPTLLYGVENWKSLEIPNLKKDYVLLYMLGKSSAARTVAKEVAKQNNLNLYTFPFQAARFFKEDTIFSEEEQLWEVSPFEWISLIDNANLIITDSFHMVVFSLMFHKNFYVVEKDSKERAQNNRILNLLEMVGLKNRFILNDITLEDIKVNKQCIDWNIVDEILDKKRKESFDLVDEIMKDIFPNLKV